MGAYSKDLPERGNVLLVGLDLQKKPNLAAYRAGLIDYNYE